MCIASGEQTKTLENILLVCHSNIIHVGAFFAQYYIPTLSAHLLVLYIDSPAVKHQGMFIHVVYTGYNTVGPFIAHISNP